MIKAAIKYKNAAKLIPCIAEMGFYEIVAVTDKKDPESLPDIPGFCGEKWNTWDTVKAYKDGIIQKILVDERVTYSTLINMVEELIAWDVDEDDILIICDGFEDGSDIVSWKQYSNIPYLEFHVSDHCNLNCKGCVHFSPLVKNKEFPVFEEVKRDFVALKKKIRRIGLIRILGGEPFLNPELDRYIKMVRELYKNATISVVTNGLLLSQISDELIKVLKDTDVTIDVSLYPPLQNNISNIVKPLIEKGVRINVSFPIKEFAYALDEQQGHARFATQNNCTCPNLYKGKLYVCPIIAYIGFYNAYFGEEFDEEDGGIDIYDDTLTFTDIKKELRKVRKICDHCLYISKEHEHTHEWEQTVTAQKEDYVLTGKNYGG